MYKVLVIICVVCNNKIKTTTFQLAVNWPISLYNASIRSVFAGRLLSCRKTEATPYAVLHCAYNTRHIVLCSAE